MAVDPLLQDDLYRFDLIAAMCDRLGWASLLIPLLCSFAVWPLTFVTLGFLSVYLAIPASFACCWWSRSLTIEMIERKFIYMLQSGGLPDEKIVEEKLRLSRIRLVSLFVQYVAILGAGPSCLWVIAIVYFS